MPRQFGECTATSRSPTRDQRVASSKEWREGINNHSVVNKSMADHETIVDTTEHGKATEMVYRLLTETLDFVSFATTARDAGLASASESKDITKDMNLEFIHNNIHYWVGGDGGHMGRIPVATFDPVFWLHHW